MDGHADARPNGISLSGANGGARGGPGGGSRTLAHIDDIKSARPTVDGNTPVDKVLLAGEDCMRSAQAYRNFSRPDLALKEYLKVTAIVVDIIPNHKGFVSLQMDRKGLAGRYAALKQAVNDNFATFEQIKKDIVADNALTGVRPSSSAPISRSTSSGQSSIAGYSDSRPSIDSVVRGNTNGTVSTEQTPGHSRAGSLGSNSDAAEPTTAQKPKAKPVIHPKPQALHGNAINPSANGAPATSKAGQDLMARFANLRATTTRSPPVQDPRIRTQSIIPPPPADPKPEPGHRPKISLSTILPDMPKAPDAVYSPARGSASGESSKIPPSTPTSRGTFSRSISTTSFSNVSTSTRASPAPTGDYFGPAQGVGGSGAPPKQRRPSIPGGDTITAEELLKLMQRGSREILILLIDVRPRDEFDEGHIMSQATICIEPDILLREDISANEIAESMVLAPGRELMLFEQRQKFGLVVCYDQHSEKINWKGDSERERAMLSLYNALAHYDFGDEAEARKPKLLEGGLDAWVSLLGVGSLQESSTTGTKTTEQQHMPAGRTGYTRPKSRYVTRPIQNEEEVQKWNETLNFARSSEQVIRRDPAVFGVKESMTDPAVSKDARFAFGSSHQAAALNNLPTAPTRPAPAVARQSYSGVRESHDGDDYVMAKLAQAGGSHARRKFPGLRNPGNWCYANSAIQSLVASPAFGNELGSGRWQDDWRVPKKKGEFIAHPQLMAKILANLFHWMETGNFEAMQAKTLMVRDDFYEHFYSGN